MSFILLEGEARDYYEEETMAIDLEVANELSCLLKRKQKGIATSGDGLTETERNIFNSQVIQQLKQISSNTKRGLTGKYVQYLDSDSALKLCIACIVLYLLFSVIAFSYLFEKWTIIDSLYFAVVTFTTIGYGDLTPSTSSGKAFTIVFVIFGITIVGFALGITGERLIKSEERFMENLKERGKKRVMSLLKGEEEEDEEDEDELEDQIAVIIKQQQRQCLNSNGNLSANENEDNRTGQQQQQQQQQQQHQRVCADVKQIIILDGPLLLLVIISSAAIGFFDQQWPPLIDSLYYCVITTTTVGYGDVGTPTSQKARLFAAFVLPVAVVTLTNFLGRIIQIYIRRKSTLIEEEFLHREFTYCDFDEMDTNKDGKVSLAEFLSFMLVAMQKVDKETVDELTALFYELDVTKSDALEKADLIYRANMNRIKSNASFINSSISSIPLRYC